MTTSLAIRIDESLKADAKKKTQLLTPRLVRLNMSGEKRGAEGVARDVRNG